MILVSRAEWGSQQTKVPVAADGKPEVYVHHVAGRTPVGADDEAKHMRELQAYAIGTKGYIDMDYNVLIGPSGRCYEGRGYFGRSAATLDRNEVSRAICLMGNLDQREPTAAQLAALPLVIADMVAKGSLRPDVMVRGHYQNPAHPNATICPGRFMIPHLDAVRAEVAALLAPTTPPTPQPPITEDPDMPIALHVTDRERSGREMVLILSGSGDPQVLSFPGRSDDRDATLAALAAERGRPVTQLEVHSDTFDMLAKDSLAENVK